VNEEKKIIELNLGDILPNRFQPRIKFNEETINQLSESIKEHGVIQPIVVRKIGDKYEIIAGERRYKASVLAGKNFIPAIITDLDDKDSAEVALIENVQRQDLTPIEEAISYKKILDMGYTQEQLAIKLGNKQSTIANKLRLLNLNEDVQEALLNGQISERHARSILRLNDSKQQSEMLNNVISQRLTVRKTDEEIDKILNNNVIDEEVELLDTTVFSNPIIENSNISEGVGQMIEDKTNNEFPDLNTNIPLSSMVEPINPKVDESSMEIFNIKPIDDIKLPSQPIIEDIEPVKPEISLPEPTQVVQEETNLGFMNIEKIENEAKDIFEDKPLADVNSLLENDPSIPVVEEKNGDEEEDNESPEKLLTPGKFFDILSEEPEEDKSTDSFSPLNNKEENQFSPFINPNVVEVPNVQHDEIDNLVVNTTPREDNKEENQFQPLTNSQPVQVEKVESNENLPIEPIFNPFIEEKKIVEEPMIESNVIDSNPSLNKNLKSVIDLVRECSKKIEQVGYSIEVEEIDFEDTYQVIFKVYK